MAFIEDVRAGDVARAEHQNRLIAEVNSHSDAIANASGRLETAESSIEMLKHPTTCLVTKYAPQSVGTNKDTVITWDVVDHDPNGIFADNKITIVDPGVYLVIGQANVQPQRGTSSTQRVLYVMRNGGHPASGALAVLSQPGVNDPNQEGAGNGMMTGRIAALNPGDVLELMLWQGSGETLQVRRDFGGCSLSVTRLL